MPLINFAGFPIFGIIDEKNTIEYKKYETKKIYYNHTIIDKTFKLVILYKSKIL